MINGDAKIVPPAVKSRRYEPHWMILAGKRYIDHVTHSESSRYRFRSNYPPAEPEALRLLAPQRGLIAIAQKQQPAPQQRLNVTAALYRLRLAAIARRRTIRCQNQTPGAVKLLLPPRQSRGISLGF